MSDEICRDCSKYDFQEALAAIESGKYSDRNEYPSDGIVIAKVGKRYRTPFETNCSLCRILLASRKSALDLYPINDKSKFNPDDLRKLLFSQSSALDSYLADHHDLLNTYELQALLASQDSAVHTWLTKFPKYLKPRALLASRKLNIELCLLLFRDKKDAKELCALLASQKSALESFSDQSEDDTDELRAFVLLKDTTVHDVSVRGSFFAWKNRSIYIDLDSSRFPLKSEQRLAHGAKHGFAVIRQTHEPPKFTAQVIPPFFDPSVAIGWISHCREHHKKTCSSPKDASAINLRLIDCETLVVEQGHSDSSYVALSYVWGSSAARDQYSLESPSGSTFTLPSVLPAVILDAIAVTKSLGFRYLWVDKFCIDHSDNDAKHQQISQMDSVYENAELTIVAAAGVDETHGLPGVGSKPRSTQPIARIGDLTVLSTMRDVQDLIRSSKWSTRGWTFQEALLTRRRLVFTEEQVYFECAAMNCSESFSGSTDALYKEWGSTSPQYTRPGIFERSGWQKFVGFRGKPGNTLNIFIRYLTAIEDYTARELRFEQDSLNAFAGIMKKFERAREPIIQLWGIPTTIQRRELTERCFAEALCWSHAHSCWDSASRPIRRPDFPSWSWAGWAGEVRYEKKLDSRFMVSQLPSIQFSEWQQSIMNATVHANISLESEDGQILELSNVADFISFGRFDAGFARILRLEADVFPTSWFVYDREAWRLLMSPAIVSLSQGLDSEDQLFEKLKKEDSGLQCIHLRSARTTMFGLIIETRGRVSSRVGLMTADWGYNEPVHSLLERRTFRIV